ncbi:uncharacterized protein LAESUDRAFT_814035 [Laetiporus sulphureus 93-53]|uniref:Uncharacterized protein n=1 Tax=Laetiporus sulphureus 93-53 TaxID=1314785 RepID=A0A165DE91_9APHY|nr:uncharacterized protein LAESUDRAFT_814035 [Laetiporus sulphureus 93-53]KZT04690.1 hypothetical protein LAESUDRAFT_814035 [Laetiporus sulphureus 93-53]
MTQDSCVYLTTSRINRLFRPLRAKCTALAEFVSVSTRKRAAVSVTYSRTTRFASAHVFVDRDVPPLALLQPPEALRSRIHLDRTSMDNLQLSRKIYDVRDAFKNILQASLGSTAVRGHSGPSSLAALCAGIVGENLHDDVEAYQEGLLQMGNDTDEHAAMEFLDDLYEAVPGHYRSFAVTSHAVSYILDVCPHHPTLLTALLDTCLNHALVKESQFILRALFKAAIRSTGQNYTPICPLAHHAHSNYLTTLRDICCSNNKSTICLQLDDYTFAALLIDVLAESGAGSVEAWTSKAVAKLAMQLQTQSFTAFIRLCSGLANSIADAEHQSTRRKSKKIDDIQPDSNAPLKKRLVKWVKSALDRLHSQFSSGDTAVLSADVSDNFNAVVDFLLLAMPLHFRAVQDFSDPSSANLTDAMVCLGTYCLAAPLASSLISSDLESLVKLLHSARAGTETFDTLVSLVFSPTPASPLLDKEPSSQSSTPTPPPESSIPHVGGLQELRRYARALRSHDIFHLEASLWSNALRHVEDILLTSNSLPFMSKPVTAVDLDAIRKELVRRVERAEARCFGARNASRLAVAPVTQPGDAVPSPASTHMFEAREPHRGEEYVWEEMISSWVRKTPVVERMPRPSKRRKVDLDSPSDQSGCRNSLSKSRLRRSQSRDSHPCSDSIPRARRSVSSTSLEVSPTVTAVASDDFDAPLSAGSTSRSLSRSPSKHRRQDELKTLNCTPHGQREAQSRARRISNFATIVADAQMNRIVLHPERKSEERSGSSDRSPQSRKSTAAEAFGDRRYVTVKRTMSRSPVRSLCTADQLSSDDALDLFAYRSSSPSEP